MKKVTAFQEKSQKAVSNKSQFLIEEDYSTTILLL